MKKFDINRHKDALILLPAKELYGLDIPVIVNGFRDKNNEVKQFAFSSVSRESFAQQQGYNKRNGYIDIFLFSLDVLDPQKYFDAYTELSQLNERRRQLERQITENDRESGNRTEWLHMITTTGNSARDLQEKITDEFFKQLNKLRQTAFNEDCYKLIPEKNVSIFLKSR